MDTRGLDLSVSFLMRLQHEQHLALRLFDTNALNILVHGRRFPFQLQPTCRLTIMTELLRSLPLLLSLGGIHD